MVLKRVLILGLCCFVLHQIKQADAQSTGQIVELSEKVVEPAGGTGVLNCSVYSADEQSRNTFLVEWVHLDATQGARTLSKNCEVIEENNEVSEIEKYQIACINTDTKITRYSLKISLLSFPDNGWYECRVRVPNKQKPTSSMKVQLTVLSPPKVSTSATPLALDAFVDGNVTISCTAEGVPAPNVTWGRANGRPLPPHRSDSPPGVNISEIATRRTLNIYNLTQSDTGTYRCSADNNIRPPDDFYAKISVQFKPFVAPVEPSYGTATGENTQVMMWCKVEGHPRPTMIWYKMSSAQSAEFADGILELDENFFASAETLVTDAKYIIEQKIMTVGSLSTMESMFYTITLQTVTPGDIGYYVCKAQNEYGTDASAIQLYRINTFADQSSAATSTTISRALLPVVIVNTLLYTLLPTYSL